MGTLRAARGFTLIELMIVVALVGVLAVLATVGYRRWTKSAYVSEAQDMVSNIRAAEDSFYAENGAYLNVSPGLGHPNCYPAATPGSFKTAWGAACANCLVPNGWQALNVQAGGPVIFGYTVIAGDGVNAPASLIQSPTINGKPLDYSALSTPPRPWFFVQADGNVSGDGVSWMHVYGMSGSSTIFVDGEGN